MVACNPDGIKRACKDARKSKDYAQGASGLNICICTGQRIVVGDHPDAQAGRNQSVYGISW